MIKEEYNQLVVGDIVRFDCTGSANYVVVAVGNDRVLGASVGSNGLAPIGYDYQEVAIVRAAFQDKHQTPGQTAKQMYERLQEYLKTTTNEELNADFERISRESGIDGTQGVVISDDEAFVSPYGVQESFLKACREHGPWLSPKNKPNQFVKPLRLENRAVWMMGETGHATFATFEDLARWWKWQDGSPCGLLCNSDGSLMSV